MPVSLSQVGTGTNRLCFFPLLYSIPLKPWKLSTQWAPPTEAGSLDGGQRGPPAAPPLQAAGHHMERSPNSSKERRTQAVGQPAHYSLGCLPSPVNINPRKRRGESDCGEVRRSGNHQHRIQHVKLTLLLPGVNAKQQYKCRTGVRVLRPGDSEGCRSARCGSSNRSSASCQPLPTSRRDLDLPPRWSVFGTLMKAGESTTSCVAPPRGMTKAGKRTESPIYYRLLYLGGFAGSASGKEPPPGNAWDSGGGFDPRLGGSLGKI